MEAKYEWKFMVITIAAFVVIFGFLTLTSVTQQSPTMDEPVHLLAGYSYLKWGDFRVNPEHPPLVKIWSALPLLWFDIVDNRSSSPYWSEIADGQLVGRFYLFARDLSFVRNDAATLFFYAKLQMVILGIVLAVFIYFWTRELFGFHAAAVALFLYGLDPNIIAHSAIVHTDMPFAALFFIGTYYFWRCLRQLNWSNAALASLLFGLAVVTKYAYPWMLLAWVMLGLWKVLGPEPIKITIGTPRAAESRWAKARLVGAVLLCSGVTAYITIWAFYGFHFYAALGDKETLPFVDVVPKSLVLQKLVPLIVHYHLFPEAWVYGQLYVLRELTRPMYFLGEVSNQGFWLYFPVGFLVKTPLPTIILLIGAGWTWLRKRAGWMTALTLLIPAAVYFSGAVVSRFNIGVRHILPSYPFLLVLIGGAVAVLWQERSRLKKGFLILAGTWLLWTNWSIYPHYLAFFNELAGGPKNAHKLLLDSNLDWGQDLKGLKKWMNDNSVKRIQLFYFGNADPEYYGIDDFYSLKNLVNERSAVSQNIDLPDHLVVSANLLYGREVFLPKQLVELMASYKLSPPLATIGHSIHVYRLDRADPQVWVNAAGFAAQKGAPLLARTLLHRALGIDPGSANAHFELGNLSALRGEWDDAIQHHRAAIKINPAYDDAHFSLANVLARQNKFDEAAHHYREALKANPHFAESSYNLGRILATQGQIEESIEYFRQTLRGRPEWADAHQNLAQALARQGKVDEAAQHYKEALRILKQSR